MQTTSHYEPIKIGLLIRALIHIHRSSTKSHTLDIIRRLKKALTVTGFEVTLAYMEEISFSDEMEKLKLLESDATQIGDIYQNLSFHFNIVEKIIYSESSTKKIYTLPTRRFNTQFLLEQPEKLLADGQFNKLEEIAKSDIYSASRCILFGESTAAAFHILRATEAVLKQYYFHHKRQNRLTKPMWASMLDQLKSKIRNKPSSTLLDALDIIRTSYRNPTQHPEAIYTIDSAQDLFGVCLDVIGKMSLEI